MQRSEPLGYRLKRLCALPVKLQILDLSHLGYTRGLGRADRERRKRKGDSVLIFSHTKPPHVHPTSTARPPKMAKKNEKGKEVAKEATAVAASAPSLARAVTEEVTKVATKVGETGASAAQAVATGASGAVAGINHALEGAMEMVSDHSVELARGVMPTLPSFPLPVREKPSPLFLATSVCQKSKYFPHRRSRDAQGHDALDVNKDGVVDSNDAADAAKKLKAGCTPTNCAVM